MRQAHDQAYRGMLVFFMGTEHVRYHDTGLWDFFTTERAYAQREAEHARET